MNSVDKNSQAPVFSIVGCDARAWFGLLSRYGFDARYLHRVIFGSFMVLVFYPLRLIERMRINRESEDVKIDESPIFIIGHWRSGTTLLHNILSQDPQFGYVTYLQGLFPHCFQKTKLVSMLARLVMPGKRPMDNMEINIYAPQEEEQALVAFSGHSVYNMWISPKHQLECWKKYALFNDPVLKKHWTLGYIKLLKLASLNFGGKRLLLKNPANTVRIPFLLEQFPKARFIYIYRNPYSVYESTKHLHRTVLPFFNLSKANLAVQEENILTIYRETIEQYHKDRHLVPSNQLIEIKYEDFIKNKLYGVKSIYSKLCISGYEELIEEFSSYLDRTNSYIPNKFEANNKSIGTVNRHLDFLFELYDYQKYVTNEAE